MVLYFHIYKHLINQTFLALWRNMIGCTNPAAMFTDMPEATAMLNTSKVKKFLMRKRHKSGEVCIKSTIKLTKTILKALLLMMFPAALLRSLSVPPGPGCLKAFKMNRKQKRSTMKITLCMPAKVRNGSCGKVAMEESAHTRETTQLATTQARRCFMWLYLRKVIGRTTATYRSKHRQHWKWQRAAMLSPQKNPRALVAHRSAFTLHVMDRGAVKDRRISEAD